MTELIVFIAQELHFLQNKKKQGESIRVPLGRRASVKDIVEALGVPHTEIGRLVLNGNDVSFSRIPEENGKLFVLPPIPPFDPGTASLLRPTPLLEIKFAVDANVGKLAMLLRAAGFDTWFENGCRDARVANIAEKEQRIVLTKDVQLLKRSKIVFGRYVRAVLPDGQLAETLSFFGVLRHVRMFSRCLRCNSPLEKVTKEQVLFRLKPKTRKYYQDFSRCPCCDKIFFKGSHYEKIKQRFECLGIGEG